MPHVIVTGASKGIGKEIARELARRKHDLVLVARTQKLLEELATELKQRHGVNAVPVALDLTDMASIDRLPGILDGRGISVTGLVNNAGFGTIGEFDTIDASTEDQMITLNVRALTRLTHLYIPRFKSARKGFVMNVASMAGLMPMAGMATYSATKAFVVSFSRSLDAEYGRNGIQILCICPGVTQTEFLDVQGANHSALPPGLMQGPGEVARYAVEQLDAGATFGVPGTLNKIGAVLAAVVPQGIAARLAYRITRPASKK